jgi:hypothetical protein
MYWQNFDVVFTIGRTAGKIQYSVESDYKFPFDLVLRRTTKKPLSICSNAYCCAVSIAAFKRAKPSNNYHKVSFLTFETCSNFFPENSLVSSPLNELQSE